ncbi:MAG: esterase-like activity of phytase family protein [Actinomycetota bacterium]
MATVAALGVAAVMVGTGSTEASPRGGDRLIGRAVLPADTFADGPTSGRYIGDRGPFEDAQPVQGFSAVLDRGDGTFWAMSDNGFGGITNSADYHLRVYAIAPEFETAFDEANPPAPLESGDGSIDVLEFIELRDPDRHIPFAIVNHFSEERILTGADFDLESFQLAADGTLWFGDEFGPFLIQTDATGKVLQPPIALPDPEGDGELRAPQNPFNEEISTLRVMNAVRAHAEANGNTKTPVVSPWEVMLVDGNDDTNVPNREVPSDGLAAADSEIHDVGQLQAAGFPVVPYTINDKDRMLDLMALGVDGIISDRPDLLREAVEEFDPTLILDDGRIDPERFDAQGHRGARNLRPENTLPGMEVALDLLMNTLETDTGVSLDGVSILDHDPAIESEKCRRVDGEPYTEDDEVFVRDLTAAEIQSTFICDALFRGPKQVNDPELSPVSVAFAAERGFVDPYVMPTVQDLFDFVDFYAEWYSTGEGSAAEGAAEKANNASLVRYNIETKINPRAEFADRTLEPQAFVDALAETIASNGLTDRAAIQSFDWRSLLLVQEQYPDIQTVYLFGDFTGDGTNLRDEDGANTPWLAGLYWPYRVTDEAVPFAVRSSGGFEGMAISPNGRILYPLLERPIEGDDDVLRIFEFSTFRDAYTDDAWFYELDERGTAIGDFVLFNNRQGLVIERDGSQGDLDGYKAVNEIRLGDTGTSVRKAETVDLMNLSNRFEIGGAGDPGDVGLGDPFAFPFVTIEDVVVINSQTIGILNDNNYPFSVGRHVGTGAPDDNEFIIVRLDDRLGTLTRLPGRGPR